MSGPELPSPLLGSAGGAVRPMFLLSRGEGIALLRHHTERLAGRSTLLMIDDEVVVTIPAAMAGDRDWRET